MSEPRKVTRKEMLDAVATITEYMPLPGMVCPGRRIKDAIRRIIEKVGEWQRRAQAMMCSEPPEYDGADLFDLVKEISDSDRRLIEEAGRKKIPNE